MSDSEDSQSIATSNIQPPAVVVAMEVSEELEGVHRIIAGSKKAKFLEALLERMSTAAQVADKQIAMYEEALGDSLSEADRSQVKDIIKSKGKLKAAIERVVTTATARMEEITGGQVRETPETDEEKREKEEFARSIHEKVLDAMTELHKKEAEDLAEEARRLREEIRRNSAR